MRLNQHSAERQAITSAWVVAAFVFLVALADVLASL